MFQNPFHFWENDQNCATFIVYLLLRSVIPVRSEEDFDRLKKMVKELYQGYKISFEKEMEEIEPFLEKHVGNHN